MTSVVGGGVVNVQSQENFDKSFFLYLKDYYYPSSALLLKDFFFLSFLFDEKKTNAPFFSSLYCPAAVRFEGGKLPNSLFSSSVQKPSKVAFSVFFYSLLSEIGENKQCPLMCKEL